VGKGIRGKGWGTKGSGFLRFGIYQPSCDKELKVLVSGLSKLRSSAPANKIVVIIWQESIKVESYTINARTISKLHLKQQAFVPGVAAYVMNRENFDKLCQASHKAPLPGVTRPDPEKLFVEIPARDPLPNQIVEAGIARALYPLAIRGETDAVRRGEIACLSPSSRRLALRSDFSVLELKHELIHDYFMGPRYSPAMRKTFVNEVVFLLKKMSVTGDAKLNRFFGEVNRRCKSVFGLGVLKDLDTARLNSQVEIGPNLFAFAGECFAYAWEQRLGHLDKRFGPVPEDLDILLRKYPLK